MSKCKSCGASILWCVTTATGKRMPIDVEPVEGGNLTVAVRGGIYFASVADLLAPADELRYVSHFATCPQADDWRGRK